jgi:hypothetical protein
MKATQHFESIHFKHEDEFYVPCYQVNPKTIGDGYPTFRFALAEGSSDLQWIESLNPDYIFVLKGTFDAKTKPVTIEEEIPLEEWAKKNEK